MITYNNNNNNNALLAKLVKIRTPFKQSKAMLQQLL